MPAKRPQQAKPRNTRRSGDKADTPPNFIRRSVRVRMPGAHAPRPIVAAGLVRAAFFAAAKRSAALRLRAADLAWRDKGRFDAAAVPSRSSAFLIAFERVRDGAFFAAAWPTSRSCSVLRRVCALVLPSAGGGKSTPAWRALDRPTAMACLADCAPCLPRGCAPFPRARLAGPGAGRFALALVPLRAF